jgi:hypothetical protein
LRGGYIPSQTGIARELKYSISCRSFHERSPREPLCLGLQSC